MLVKQIKWSSEHQQGFDVSDYFSEGGTKEKFTKLVIDAKEYKDINQIRPYNIIGAQDFYNKKIEKHDPIIEELILHKSISILAGPTGVGKSIFAVQLGLAVATGAPDFLWFEIPKPRKILYLNYEINEELLHSRIEKMLTNIPNTELLNKNFHINRTDEGSFLFTSQWDRIEETVKESHPHYELVIVDNLYTSTDADEERNYNLKELLSQIDSIRNKYSCSILLVTHHIKKSTDDKYLELRMVRGGSILTNFADVVFQMGD